MQLIALGFTNPDFHGEIIAELERLHQSGTARVIDSLAVYKDADGELEVQHLSNLSEDEAIELGSKIGALIGLGFEGEEGMEAGAVAVPCLIQPGRVRCATNSQSRVHRVASRVEGGKSHRCVDECLALAAAYQPGVLTAVFRAVAETPQDGPMLLAGYTSHASAPAHRSR